MSVSASRLNSSFKVCWNSLELTFSEYFLVCVGCVLRNCSLRRDELSTFFITLFVLWGFLSYLLEKSFDSLETNPTRLKTSLIRAPFILRSNGLAHAMDGDMFISSNHGLSASSINIS